mgnify:CR=1 FL=1
MPRFSDKITQDADWRDGMNEFRLKCREELSKLNAMIDMLSGRIKDLEDPPKAPHARIKKEEEELKLWQEFILRK